MIFHQAALGDFVLSWPIALMLGRTMAQSRVIYVTPPGKGALAERAISVESRDADRYTSLFAAGTTIPDNIRKSIVDASHIITFVSSGQDEWARQVRAINPQVVLIPIKARPDVDGKQHLMLFHAEQFKQHPTMYAPLLQMIEHVARNGAVARKQTGAATVIHPGSGGRNKLWPLERFVELAASLGEQGHSIVVALGEVEIETLSPAEIASLGKVGKIVRPATLVELFELLATARLLVGNDSGPAHLAAILGVPTVALFGRDNEQTWRPAGPRVRVLRRVPIDQITTEMVIETTRELLETAPAEEVGVRSDEE